jgi:glucose-1-phosphate thymidylyltransferase
MKAIILTAGYATRMYPLTLDRPKALLPLGGRPMINYIVDHINTLPDVNEIIVVSNHKFFNQFEKWEVDSMIPVSLLNDGSTFVDDRLGAIGDIHFTLREKEINEEIVVIAGDNYITYPLREQYDFYKNIGHDTVCAKKITDKEQLKSFAVAVLDDRGKILSLVEKPADPPSDTAVFATYFYKTETLPLFDQYLKEGNNPDAPGYFVQWLYKVKDVYAYIMNGDCFDIGTIAAYEEMHTKSMVI